MYGYSYTLNFTLLVRDFSDPLCDLKVAEEVMPPAAVLKVANVLSNVIPEVKFFPTKDLAELAFRNYKYREMVRL